VEASLMYRHDLEAFRAEARKGEGRRLTSWLSSLLDALCLILLPLLTVLGFGLAVWCLR
jgi:hypothetical protein